MSVFFWCLLVDDSIAKDWFENSQNKEKEREGEKKETKSPSFRVELEAERLNCVKTFRLADSLSLRQRPNYDNEVDSQRDGWWYKTLLSLTASVCPGQPSLPHQPGTAAALKGRLQIALSVARTVFI